MSSEIIKYSIESFLYPAHVTRVQLKEGKADWPHVLRRMLQLATERKEQVMLYSFSSRHGWTYEGKCLPNGDFYDFEGDGPFVLDKDGWTVRKSEVKEGGAA